MLTNYSSKTMEKINVAQGLQIKFKVFAILILTPCGLWLLLDVIVVTIRIAHS